MINKQMSPKRWEYFLFLSIPVAFYIFVAIIPIFVGLGYSFTDWGGGKKISFVMFKNYIRLVNDKEFWHSFINNMKVIGYCLVGQVGLGFLFAVLLNSQMLRLRSLYRFFIFLPVILPGVVVGYLWLIVYNSQFGLLNQLLSLIGLSQSIQVWLANSSVIMRSISIVLIWQFVGLNVVIFLASLQNISADVMDAAEIDGANGLQKVIHIITPLMKSTIKVAIILCVSGNMKIFDHIWVMTRGGPGTTSSVLAIYAYKMSFENMNFGYGSTISMGTILLSLGIVLVVNMLMRRSRNA
jgi:raffinose/stachyose/melibiose transport system permease protein